MAVEAMKPIFRTVWGIMEPDIQAGLHQDLA